VLTCRYVLASFLAFLARDVRAPRARTLSLSPTYTHHTHTHFQGAELVYFTAQNRYHTRILGCWHCVTEQLQGKKMKKSEHESPCLASSPSASETPTPRYLRDTWRFSPRSTPTRRYLADTGPSARYQPLPLSTCASYSLHSRSSLSTPPPRAPHHLLYTARNSAATTSSLRRPPPP
jgi:hypothetical protein